MLTITIIIATIIIVIATTTTTTTTSLPYCILSYFLFQVGTSRNKMIWLSSLFV